MKLSELKIGMRISHPRHGVGTVTAIHNDSATLLYGKMTVAALTKNEIRACIVVN